MSATAYPRFTKGQRQQHLVLLVSFTLLALTGLPQKYASSRLGEGLIELLGGIEMVRILHRVAAVALMGATLVHLLDVAYRILVRGLPVSMRFGVKDVKDAWQTVRYNLGKAGERPRMGRFTFEEKVEYWSLLWGTVIMVITGFALWNPIATARFLPGQAIPAALAAHGGEALLAVLAIVVWHGYGVHLRHFNRSMFTGSLSEEEMRQEHPLELEERRADPTGGEWPAEVQRRRRKWFLPAAAIFSLIFIVGVYVFVTFEQTALATVAPPQ